MAKFFAELKRRHIYRVAAAYAVVAWVLLQLIANVAPILELPPWVARSFLLLLVIGFPLTILLAWTREPEGDPTQRAMAGRLDWALMGALVLVIALVSYQQLASMSGIPTATQKPGVEAAREAAAIPAGAISIAVLPFANLSGDANQEFFSDGITEEITGALAKVPDLRVVARTSAFEFKGQNRNIQTIGQQLQATHLIEGSVRKAGERVRITAQLINASDGTHMWSENYDRELTDIFAIQEDIARAIAASLRRPLGLKEGEALVASRSINTEVYQDYLRALAFMRGRNLGTSLRAPIALLEQVVTAEPNYAPAWALLSQAYALAPNYDPVHEKGSVSELRLIADAMLPKAEAAARRAIQLDPRNAEAYAGLGNLGLLRGKFLDAEQALTQALDLDPLNPDALHWYSQVFAAAGRLKEAVGMREQLRSIEPLVPVFNSITDRTLVAAGENDRALAIAEALPFNYGQRALDLARIYAAMGRFKEAADAALSAPGEAYARGAVETAARLLRMAPAGASEANLPYLGRFSFAYVYAGAPERALEITERGADAGYVTAFITALNWQPDLRAARKTERFEVLARKLGLVDYWRAKGWPDQCRPTTGDNFECD